MRACSDRSHHAAVPDAATCPHATPSLPPHIQVLNGSKLLAVADEEGWLCVVDTAAGQLPSSLHMDAACAPKAQWLAHQNTIYDIAWAKVRRGRCGSRGVPSSLAQAHAGARRSMQAHAGARRRVQAVACRPLVPMHGGPPAPLTHHTTQPTPQNDSLLYTAAGDHHVGVWDTHTAALRCYCKGHAGSVKAVAAHAAQPDVLASGGCAWGGESAQPWLAKGLMHAWDNS